MRRVVFFGNKVNGVNIKIIISRGLSDPLPGMDAAQSANFDKQWTAQQQELAGLSERSSHHIAGQSGHYIQLDQPDLVIEAVKGLIR